MQTIGILLLAAATAGDGFGYDKPGVGLKPLLRHSVVAHGAAPPGGPITMPPGAGMNPAAGRRFANVKSQIYFLDPDGMKIGWQTGGGPGSERVWLPAQLTVPARHNFLQGYIYRLKLTGIAGRPGVQLYPTIEVAASTPPTDAYLTHNPIPVQFTAEDFDQVVDGGNFVTKVIYLPDPKYQELAIAGVETLVSTRLEPGVDPILEADKRGTILLIVRLGAIDLEMPTTGSASPNVGAAPTTNVAPGAALQPGTVLPSGTALPPGTLPPGVVTSPVTPAVPVDTNPATVTPPVPPPANPSPTAPPPQPEPPAAEKPEMPADDAKPAPAPAPEEKAEMPEKPEGAPPPPEAPQP